MIQFMLINSLCSKIFITEKNHLVGNMYAIYNSKLTSGIILKQQSAGKLNIQDDSSIRVWVVILLHQDAKTSFHIRNQYVTGIIIEIQRGEFKGRRVATSDVIPSENYFLFQMDLTG